MWEVDVLGDICHPHVSALHAPVPPGGLRDLCGELLCGDCLQRLEELWLIRLHLEQVVGLLLLDDEDGVIAVGSAARPR